MNSSEDEVIVMDRILLSQSSLPNFTESSSQDIINETQGQDYYEGDTLYEVPLSIVVLLSVFYGSICITTVTGNFLVLWVIAVSRRMQTVTNFLICDLAFADIIIGLFAIPFQFQAALLQRWNLPHFLCAFCPFIQVLSVNVSVLTLSAIAVDRYRAVLYPLSPRISKRKATLTIIGIWVFSILLAVPTELDFRVIEAREKGSVKPFCQNVGLSDGFRKYYLLTLVVIQYFLPIIIITGAYARIATRLWGATAPGNKEESRDAVVLRNKKKVIKMLTIVVLLFALCWLPLQMYNFFSVLFPAINEYQYINIIWFCFHWLAMSNSCCNPFIYAIYNEKFQREFRARLHCFKICRRKRTDSPCSELSDFDRSRVRASYRFHTASAAQRVHRPSSRRHPNMTTNISTPRKNGVGLTIPERDGSPFQSIAQTHQRSPDDVDLITNLTTL